MRFVGDCANGISHKFPDLPQSLYNVQPAGCQTPMRNNPRREFWFFSLSLIALRLADVGITYVVTPDLRWEINPLVSLAGLGWLALIVANVLGVAVVIVLFYFSLAQAPSGQPQEPGYTQKEFISHYLFGDRNSFRKIYYVVPHNRMAIVHYTAYVFIRVLTLWSFVVVLHNVLVWQSAAFRNLMSDWQLWLGVYVLLVILVLHFSLRFFKALYARYTGEHG